MRALVRIERILIDPHLQAIENILVGHGHSPSGDFLTQNPSYQGFINYTMMAWMLMAGYLESHYSHLSCTDVGYLLANLFPDYNVNPATQADSFHGILNELTMARQRIDFAVREVINHPSMTFVIADIDMTLVPEYDRAKASLYIDMVPE